LAVVTGGVSSETYPRPKECANVALLGVLDLGYQVIVNGVEKKKTNDKKEKKQKRK